MPPRAGSTSMRNVHRRRWTAPVIATLYLAACGVVGYCAEWRQPTVHLRWTWTLTYFGIPLGCLLVGLLERRARWTVACAIAGPVLWLTGYTLLWQGDPRRGIFVAIAIVAVVIPTALFSGLAAIVAMAVVGPADRGSVGSTSPRCAGCGYDLTGNVSGRCSECGRVIALGCSQAESEFGGARDQP